LLVRGRDPNAGRHSGALQQLHAGGPVVGQKMPGPDPQGECRSGVDGAATRAACARDRARPISLTWPWMRHRPRD
jgi:hypothetical protein